MWSANLRIVAIVLPASLLAVGINYFLQFKATGSTVSSSAKELEKCLLLKGIETSSLKFRDRTSNKAEYDILNYQWNQCNGLITPFLYVLPETVEDVQNTIRCAQSLGIRVVARSGGHSAMKYSFGDSDSVVIDLQKQNSVIINSDARTADTGSGVRGGSELLASDGYFLPPGLCSTVGISFALGGGYTNYARLYGYVLDSVLELDMVDYQGSLITANSTSNSDLFWALRGGGTGGSFGLVTRYKFQLHQMPQKIIYGRSEYPIHMFPEVFDAYQKFSVSNSDRRLYLGLLSSNTKIKLELVQGVFEGQDPTQASMRHILQSLLPVTNSTVISTLNYSEFPQASLDFLEGGERIKGDELKTTDNPPIFLKEKSFFVKKILGSSEIAKLNELIRNSTTFVNILWQLHGGAIDDVRPDETAFVHREGTLYKVNLFCGGPPDSLLAEQDVAREWMRNFFDVTKQIMGHTTSYQNIPDDEMEDYLERFYAGNLQRLQEVKTKYDPHNYFKYSQSIPTL